MNDYNQLASVGRADSVSGREWEGVEANGCAAQARGYGWRYRGADGVIWHWKGRNGRERRDGGEALHCRRREGETG